MNFPPDAVVDTTSTRSPAFGAHPPVRTFLTWLVLACLLPGVIGAVILFIYEYGQRRIQQEQDMLQTTRALVQAVDNHLFKVQAVAQALSVSDTLARHDLARFHQQARKAVTLSGMGNAVILSNEAGQQLLNTAAEFGAPLPRRAQPERVRQVFSIATPVFSDVVIGGVLDNAVGFLFDDGTTWRLSDTRYLMTTTTANGALVMQHLEGLLGRRVGLDHHDRRHVAESLRAAAAGVDRVHGGGLRRDAGETGSRCRRSRRISPGPAWLHRRPVLTEAEPGAILRPPSEPVLRHSSVGRAADC